MDYNASKPSNWRVIFMGGGPLLQIRPGKDAKHLYVGGFNVPKKYLLNYKQKGEELYVESNLLNKYQLGLLAPVQSSPKDVLNSRLKEYQKRDVKRMLSQPHILNANPMGYGKTVETIVTLKTLNAKRILIVAPKSILPQWEQELNTWWPEHPQISVRPKSNEGLPASCIILTNYESMRISLLTKRIWDVMVCDESHKIKNRKSQRWNTVMQVPAMRKIALTGTPILRHVDDLWAQLAWLNWEYSGLSYWKFVEFFLNIEDGFYGKEIGSIQDDPEKVRLLNWLVNEVAIRNTDLNLTLGKEIHTVPIKMDPKQSQVYKDAKDLAYDTLPETLTISTAMTHLLRLRQVTSCPEIFDPTIPNAKLEWLEEQVESNPDTKFVVYSNWSSTIKQVQKKFKSKCVSFTGSNSPETNKYAKEEFIKNLNVQIIAGTIGAMGIGIDGLQQVSSTAVFFDRDWSPEINAQAEDRLNRIGQPKLVHIYYLECKGTMDKYVSKVNLTKAEDIKEALDSNE